MVAYDLLTAVLEDHGKGLSVFVGSPFSFSLAVCIYILIKSSQLW